MNATHTTITVYQLLLFLAVAIILSACTSITAHLSGKSAEELDTANIAEARRLVSTLETKNSSLKNFKGIGTIKVWNNDIIKIDERVAWIGSEPLKISIVVLISGFPAVKLASDGEWFYYLEIRGRQVLFKKTHATNANLKRLIAIPVHPNDVITLLTGRIPMREHHSAYIKENKSDSGYVLILKKRWWGIIEKIYLNEAKSRVRQIELFNRSGSLVYRVVFEKIKEIQGYRLPFRLRISNDDGADCQLDIDRYWADVSVTPSTFVLTPPE
ncbi:MAG: DUF4292 domain-containing protein [Desulfobacterales bacterium]|nr:MAG: DUF4292 domain-containing protein [Desulfobacterales bacterium]